MEDIYVGGGKYILGKKLGSGSFGQIYLGTNKHTKEFVGVKLVYSLISVRNRKKPAHNFNWQLSLRL